MSDFDDVRAKVRAALDEIGVELGRGVEIFAAERPGRFKIETPLDPPPIKSGVDAWFARAVVSGFGAVLDEYEWEQAARKTKDTGHG